MTNILSPLPGILFIFLKKIVSLNDSDDDDFVDEKKQKGKRAEKTKGSKVNDSFDIDAIFNSDDDTINATDTTIEIDEEFENDLEQINALKLLFNAQVKPEENCRGSLLDCQLWNC